MISKKDFYSILQEVDSIANKYNPGCNSYFNSKLYTEGIRRDFNVILRYFSGNSDKKMLDFGCGTGFLAVLLSRFFKKCHGVDVDFETDKIFGASRSNVEIRKQDYLNRKIWKEYEKRYKIIFNDYNGKKLLYPENYFNGIIAHGVIEHIAEDLLEEIIKELFRVLDIGGILFIFKTPRDQSYTERIKRSHEKLMNEKELSALLQSHGFKILELYRVDILPEFYPFGFQRIINFLTPVIFSIQNLLDKSPINFLCHNMVIIAKKY